MSWLISWLLVFSTWPLSMNAFAQVERGDGVLAPGQAAPALQVDMWIRGSPLERFEPGQIYVVEFWATWCAPCLANIPHLSALQREYAERGVTVIGVSARDANGNTLERVQRLVAGRSEEIAYSIAWDGYRRTYDAWMKAARERNIPRAFVVDREGRIAFIGHPLFLEVPLARIFAGTWEVESGMAEVEHVRTALERIDQLAQPEQALEEVLAFEEEFPAYELLAREYKLEALRATDRAEEALVLATAMVQRAIERRHASELDALARGILAHDPSPPELDLALRSAEEAVGITRSASAITLETLARVLAARGDLDGAIAAQERAVKAAIPSDRRRLEEVLSELRKSRAEH
jgi:thiol-disulfide isomerase/thioredoxin